MTWRYRIIFLCILFGFLIVVARLFYWQVVKAEELQELGRSQYGQTIVVQPQRGHIKTSDNYPIATNKLTYRIFANPKEVADKEQTATLLSTLLEIDKASISAQLEKDKFWVPLKSYVEPKIKQEIEKHQIPGVGYEELYTRYYPEGSMSAQLLGFVGKNDLGEDKGYFGLEGYYDRQLAGKAGTANVVKDALGRPIVSQLSGRDTKIDGRSLVLNIDRAIQFMVEKRLKTGIDKYGAEGGLVIVMNPKTGAILAMAALPSFDHRNFIEYDPKLYKNPIVSNVFEPGSTFKPLVMAAAIDAKVVKPDTKCPICSEPLEIGGYTIKTWNNKYYENTTMIDVIRHSDNTGMVYSARALGLDRLIEYLNSFGIGKLTGIDLQGEVSPDIRPRDSWYPIDLATASFGQGIHVTAIELLTAFSAIANDGKRMEPHVVARIETPEGEIVTIPPKVINNPISVPTAKVMTEILVNAVNKGESQWIKPKGYRVAGKTGTAQIPIEGHYDPNKTLASFIGFAPADDPKFSMLVVVDRPTSSIYGSETAAPIFMEIARDIFAYYGISPTEIE